MTKQEKQIRQEVQLNQALDELQDTIKSIENDCEQLYDTAEGAMMNNDDETLDIVVSSILELSDIVKQLRITHVTFTTMKVKANAYSHIGSIAGTLNVCADIARNMPNIGSLSKSISKLSKALARGKMNSSIFSKELVGANKYASTKTHSQKEIDAVKESIAARIAGKMPAVSGLSEFSERIEDAKKKI